MDSPRWVRIQALFHGAADLPPSEQRGYLNTACGGDEALMAEVLAMLEDDSRSGSLLEWELPEVAHALLDGPMPADEFEGYLLQKTLGEGGMGVVYLAEREGIGGQVAIKIMRDGLLSPARRARFADEQRMLAKLNHPFIARIFDAHTSADGTPWFVMEYVDGLPITQYCRNRESSIENRLQLLRSVCEAVQYAHAHAIIHRDLKPSNILVTTDGVVKLVDFGIAKQMESGIESTDRRTQTGLRPMTLAYASPEQIRGGDFGIQTDVYSLGVILYELLTEVLPLDVSSHRQGEAEQIVLHQEPLPPSTVVMRRLKAPGTGKRIRQVGKTAWSELDVLSLTAMHKDLHRRYRSVEALMRDIDHYLKAEPLEARPDTLRYRAGKFVIRNRRALSVTATVLAVMAVLVTFFAMRLASARAVAQTEASRTQCIERFMLNLFDGGDQTAGPADDLRVVALLERGTKNAQALKTDPSVQAELYQTLGNIYQKLGKLDRADPLLRAALERRRSIGGSQSDDVAGSLIALGLLRLDQSRIEEGERLVREGMAIYRKRLPVDAPAVAKANFALGRVLEERGAYRDAIKILDQTVRLQSAQPQVTTDLSDSMNALVIANIYIGDFAVAETLDRRALTMDRQLYGEIHPRVADDLANLGVIQFDLRHFAEAEQDYRQAFSIKQSWYGREHPDTAICMVGVGQALTAQRRYDEAADMLHQALAIQERVYGKSHAQIAIGLNMLGSLELRRGHLDDAESDFRRMADINRAVYGDKHSLVGVALENLGEVYFKKGQYLNSERQFREALKDFTATLAPGHPHIGVAQLGLGRTLVAQRRYKDAEGCLLAGYEILTKQPSPSAKDIAEIRENLIIVYDALHQPDLAARFQAELAASPADHTGAPAPK